MLDFIGIGAQKTGTTWLYDHLRHHPDIRFPAGKEIHFWDLKRHLGVEWYDGLFAGDHGGAKVGEITPAYAILDRAVVEEIRRRYPDLRIFYLVRNPIERAWSQAVMFLKFMDMTLDEASDQWFIDNFHSAASLRRSDFETCLRVWRSVFPQEQILVEDYARIRNDPRGLLKTVARHIGVAPDFADGIPDEALSRPVHEGYGAPIRPSLRPVLTELYDHKIDSLSAYLGRDLSLWKAAGRGWGASAAVARAAGPAEADAIRLRMSEVVQRHGPWTAHNIRLAPGVFTIAEAALNIEEKARRAVQIVCDATGRTPPDLRVLDLGSHEGGFAIEFAAQGAHVVGLEGRADNVARAEFACDVLGLGNLTFHLDDVRNLTPDGYGRFDAVLCFGLLYHFDAPDLVDVLRRIRAVTERVAVIDTHYALEDREYFEADGKRYYGCSYREHAGDASAAETANTGWGSIGNVYSFWLTRPSLVNCLSDVGFTSVFESAAPLTYDYFDRSTFERYKYPDRGWFVALTGHDRPVASEPLVNEVPRRRLPENFGDRMLPSPSRGREALERRDPSGPLPVERVRGRTRSD